jgi:hypothetical protein
VSVIIITFQARTTDSAAMPVAKSLKPRSGVSVYGSYVTRGAAVCHQGTAKTCEYTDQWILDSLRFCITLFMHLSILIQLVAIHADSSL